MIKRQYIRIPNDNNLGRGAPIGLVIMDKTHDGNINMGFSLCSTNDTFSKERANTIAQGRFDSGRYRGSDPESILNNHFERNSSIFDILNVANNVFNRLK